VEAKDTSWLALAQLNCSRLPCFKFLSRQQDNNTGCCSKHQMLRTARDCAKQLSNVVGSSAKQFSLAMAVSNADKP
jgi:hypothetical protein